MICLFKVFVVREHLFLFKVMLPIQIKEEDAMIPKGVFVTGMSIQAYNGLWEVMERENDGKPAFQKNSSFGDTYFLYFRKEENVWVIDDIIDYTGPVFSRCQTGTNMDGIWSTTPNWCRNPNIKVEKIKNEKGYNGEAILVSGCENQGGSLSVKENGVYLRQPPYDDINNKAHYILIIDEKERRHLFFDNRGWQICPVCTDEEGTHCMSMSTNITGRWSYTPNDKVEDKARFQLLNEDVYPDYVRKPAPSYARSEIRDRAQED